MSNVVRITRPKKFDSRPNIIATQKILKVYIKL